MPRCRAKNGSDPNEGDKREKQQQVWLLMKEKTTHRSTTFTCRRHHGDGGHNGDGDHGGDDSDGGGDVNDRLNDNWMTRSRQQC